MAYWCVSGINAKEQLKSSFRCLDCILFLHAFCFLAVVALEEQKANLSRELSALRNTHNKVRYFWLTSMRMLSNHCLILKSSGFLHVADVLFFSFLFFLVGPDISGTFGKEEGV